MRDNSSVPGEIFIFFFLALSSLEDSKITFCLSTPAREKQDVGCVEGKQWQRQANSNFSSLFFAPRRHYSSLNKKIKLKARRFLDFGFSLAFKDVMGIDPSEHVDSSRRLGPVEVRLGAVVTEEVRRGFNDNRSSEVKVSHSFACEAFFLVSAVSLWNLNSSRAWDMRARQEAWDASLLGKSQKSFFAEKEGKTDTTTTFSLS